MRHGPSLRDRVRGAVTRLRKVAQPSRADREMIAEMAFHLDMEIEKNIRAGMSSDEARRRARLAFGGTDRYGEEVRDARSINWLDDLRLDARYALRGFRRSPGYAAAAIGALALGIGTTAAVFSVAYGVVLAPLPYRSPEELVRLTESNVSARVERAAVTPGTLVDLRARSRSFGSVALINETRMLFFDGAESWEGRVAAVSPSLFALLGIGPTLGRAFSPETTANYPEREAVISHELWVRRFGQNPDVLGRSLQMEKRWPYTIVGVMPPGFAFPSGADLWVPQVYSTPAGRTLRQLRYYDMIGRLKSDVKLDDAARELAGISRQLQVDYPATSGGWTIRVEPLALSIVGPTRTPLFLLLGLAACVLLIACGNVASLAVARATARGQETALRLALGAGLNRLIRLWLAEGLMLAACGGVAGLVLGYYAAHAMLTLAPRDIPRLEHVGFGLPAIGFTVLASIGVGILVGLAPAWPARDLGASSMLRSRADVGVIGSTRRGWVLAAQVALTFVLLVSSALLLRSFASLLGADLGYRTHDVVAARIKVPIGRFSSPRPWYQRVRYYDELLADLRAVPGVASVAGVSDVPLTAELGSGALWPVDAPGASGSRPPASAADQWTAAIQVVTPTYFAVMGTPLVSGRPFDNTDRFSEKELTEPSPPKPVGVAIVNEAMARRYWPGQSPIGKSIVIFDDQTWTASRTIVGVVRDMRVEAVADAAPPTLFLPFAQHPGRGLSLLVRTDLPPAQIAPTLARRIHEFDGTLSLSSVRPLDVVVRSALARQRFTALVAVAFAAIALILATVGIFGIVAYLVAHRSREIGIRMALGAGPGAVLRMVVGQGLRPVLVGAIAGCVGALGVERAMRALLYGSTGVDAASFLGAATAIAFIALLATIVPARRAIGLDPLQSLRAQ